MSERWRGPGEAVRKGASPRGRGSAAVVMLVAVVLLLLGAPVAPVSALGATESQTILGTDRCHSSILISQAGFAPGVEAVVVCDGTSCHSATCSAPLAALHGGPVLLTPGDLPDARVNVEIARISPGKIFAVGLGTTVVDAIKAAYPELDASGSIVTLLGADAYDTARLVAEEIGAKAGAVTGVVLVPSDPTLPYVGYSVSVAPLAAAKGWPILLTPVSGPLPDLTAQAIEALDAPFVL